MNGEDDRRWNNPEAIFNSSPDELRARREERRRRFVDNGPPELRELRERCADSMAAATKAINVEINLRHKLNQARNSDAEDDVTRAIEAEHEAACSALNEAKATSVKLYGRLQREVRRIKLEEFPLEIREEAGRLVDQLGAELEKAMRMKSSRAGEVGRIAGTQFQIFFAINAAKSGNDLEKLERLEAKLKEAQAEMADIDKEVQEGAKKQERIRRKYQKRLDALKRPKP